MAVQSLSSDVMTPERDTRAPAPSAEQPITAVHSQNGEPRQTVVSQVMGHIKALISDGNYRPGDRIPTEQELAQRFGVGRSSIREAIKVFEHLGVLEAKAAKGTFVRERASISAEAISWAVLLGNDDLRDVLQLRELIEGAAFSRLVRSYHAGEDDARRTVERIGEQVALIRAAAIAGDIDRVIEGDYAFHGLVIDAGGNALFSELYRTLHGFMRLEIRQSYRAISDLRESADDHDEILAALTGSSAADAIARHAAHFGRTRRLLSME